MCRKPVLYIANLVLAPCCGWQSDWVRHGGCRLQDVLVDEYKQVMGTDPRVYPIRCAFANK